jgi:hypothetical protein
MNVWFSVYNSLQSLTAQRLTVVLVIGSYLMAEYCGFWTKPITHSGKSRSLILA